MDLTTEAVVRLTQDNGLDVHTEMKSKTDLAYARNAGLCFRKRKYPNDLILQPVNVITASQKRISTGLFRSESI